MDDPLHPGSDAQHSLRDHAPPKVKFSTEDFRQAQRFERFVDFFQSVSAVDFTSPDPEQYACQIEVDLFPGVSLMRARTAPLEARLRAKDATHGDDRLVIQLCMGSAFQVEQSAAPLTVQPGEAVVVRNDVPGCAHFAAGNDMHAVLIDRDLVRALLRTEWSKAAVLVPETEGALRLLKIWIELVMRGAAWSAPIEWPKRNVSLALSSRLVGAWPAKRLPSA